jgi:hypothetical protein
MILMRATMKVVPLAQCGIPDSKRFSFFDQGLTQASCRKLFSAWPQPLLVCFVFCLCSVHTTGMDIPQPVNGVAVLTLGKDMTFRGTNALSLVAGSTPIYAHAILLVDSQTSPRAPSACAASVAARRCASS